jgi:hypothetical protein
MAHPRILVVGTVRNVAFVLEREVKRISELLSPLGSYRIHIVESDSTDGTKNVLESLKARFDFFSFTSLGDLRDKFPDRIERLIHCRNEYIKEIRENKEFRLSEFTIVIDLDNKNSLLQTENIKMSLNRDVDYAGLFANQAGRYYDILALRHPIWSPKSVTEELVWYQNFLSKSVAKEVSIFRRMVKIPKHTSLIPVESAFGGFAIYKTSWLLKFDYSREFKDQKEDIDHVILNRKIRNSGGLLFIDPQLLNFKWNSHSLEFYPIYRRNAVWIKRFYALRNRVKSK